MVTIIIVTVKTARLNVGTAIITSGHMIAAEAFMAIFRASHVADALPRSGSFCLNLHVPVLPSCWSFSVCTTASRHGNRTVSLIFLPEIFAIAPFRGGSVCAYHRRVNLQLNWRWLDFDSS